MVRKVLLGGAMLVSLFCVVGCSNTDTNVINITPANKAEEVVKHEYVSRIERLAEDTINNDIVIVGNEDIEKEDEYDKKYFESEVFEEKIYGGHRDRYKDLTEGLSKFRTTDEDVNKLHDKLIEVSQDIFNMYSEVIALAKEEKEIYDKKGDFTDEEVKRLDEISEQKYTLEDMIDNQIEHTGNIAREISDILGID